MPHPRELPLRVVEAAASRPVLAERADVLVDVRTADDRDQVDLRKRAPPDFAGPPTTHPLLGCDEPQSERIVVTRSSGSTDKVRQMRPKEAA
jgi:hypothetical protein